MTVRGIRNLLPDPNVLGQQLFVGRGLNMQSTSDQPLARLFLGNSYCVDRIVAKRVSGAASVLCAGGIYTQPSKTGDIIVAATQLWAGLAAGSIVQATLAGLLATNIETDTPFLSLTVVSLTACTCDLFVYGFGLD